MGYQREKIDEIRHQLIGRQLSIFYGYNNENTKKLIAEVLRPYNHIEVNNTDELAENIDDIRDLEYNEYLVVNIECTSYKNSDLLTTYDDRVIKGINIPNNVNIIIIMDYSHFYKFKNREDMNQDRLANYYNTLIVEVNREFKIQTEPKMITF